MRGAVIGAIAALALAGCGGEDVSQAEKDRAVAAAKRAYEAAVARGVEMGRGPCIAQSLDGVPGWVADVAHDPREDVDDRAENQCRSFRDGRASHFVELTPEGELIRAR